jgi:hypothetical protein
MTTENTTDATPSRTGTAWILVFAFASFVAGVGVMIDARQGAILFLGESLAYGGIMLMIIWLLARGTRPWIVLSVFAVLFLAWLFRGVPAGGVSAADVRKMATGLGILLAVIAAIELFDRRKKRRQRVSEETP